MQITLVANPQACHQRVLAQALQSGFTKHGFKPEIVTTNDAIQTKAVACWGWRNGLRYREMGYDVMVMERAYLGDRFSWFSLGWNGLNNRATHPYKTCSSRFDKHFGKLFKPVSKKGDYVLLIGQVDGDMSLQGRSLNPWYQEIAKACAEIYGLPVKFRPHPIALQRGQAPRVRGAEYIGDSLEDALNGAAVVVTYNSNTGVESVLAGKTTITMDEGAMAWPVTAHALGETVNADRKAWANEMAWKQWQLNEIESGEAIDLICTR